jgi:DNA repair protein RecO (recombination protein O)
MLVDTEAIVLQTRKFSDTSKIAVVFTNEFGKCSIIAKGALSSKSKFGGTLEVLSHINATIYQKQSGLHLLKSAELLTSPRHITKDYSALAIALVGCEFVNVTQQEMFSNQDLFVLTNEFLSQLDDNTNRALELCVDFLVGLTINMGFDLNELPQWTRSRAFANMNLHPTDFVIPLADFKNIIHFLERYLSEQLGKHIIIKSLSLFD